MKIALAQMTSSDDVQQNLKTIESFVVEASQQKLKPEVIFFPENSMYFRIRSSDQPIPLLQNSSELNQLLELSAHHQMALHLTTPIELNGQTYNASVLIEKRTARFVYKKIHLFDIALTGQQPIRESSVFKHGDQATTFELNRFKIGSTICYDIRFAELFSKYANQKVDAVVIPSAFLVRTGQAHWMTLLRARAIESQCYVVAPAQWGRHASVQHAGEFRETYGHSAVVDPWGDIIALKESGTGLVYAELSKDRIHSVRSQMPMSEHRRL